jgi:hypothetical protein
LVRARYKRGPGINKKFTHHDSKFLIHKPASIDLKKKATDNTKPSIKPILRVKRRLGNNRTKSIMSPAPTPRRDILKTIVPAATLSGPNVDPDGYSPKYIREVQIA